ncbi:hypothetical protein BDV34DRAFT_86964 [Aspergillus parasiticus]|uniref:Uncharacterized protein n=1 Tax=Aspergillus parasiticus TaxID=5067 RepID=A0A5N6E278_ASPPA|nr:hypothetical protein BDV34DRAFT_86964 [Aspergillus parasiticus]
MARGGSVGFVVLCLFFPSLYLDFLRGARTRSGPFYSLFVLVLGRHEPRRSLLCIPGSFFFAGLVLIEFGLGRSRG